MSQNHQEQVEQILNELIKLNPFDAVIIVKKESGCIRIEMNNPKAEKLSKLNNFERGMLAKDFFQFLNWDKFEGLFHQPQNDIESFTHNEDGKSYGVFVQPIKIADSDCYYSIVIRQEINSSLEVIKSSKNHLKHLLFVEQYVDPIITVDVNGIVIHINEAAQNKFLKGNTSMIGKNLLEQIDHEYKVHFQTIFNHTLNGFPMGIPKLLIDHPLFNKEPFNIRTFPTYWDNQVIGAHIILKESDFFLTDGSPYQIISYQDELTGLLNRKALNEQWVEEISKFEDGLNVALLIVDLDRFKKYNESLGKYSADQLLKMVSTRLLTLRNELCELYRYNGDQFVFIMRYFARDEIESFANKILSLFKDPFNIEDQEYFITASIGISICSFMHNHELESVLHQAEQAVYYAKHNGRFHYRFYRSEMRHAFPNEVLMEAHLKRAIEFNELSIHLQPQIDLHNNSIDSFEALIRWNNRKFGLVPPSQFIPLAESSGLIIQIGDWVLEQVCQNIQDWNKKGYRPVRVAVNISPKQFKEENFASKIEHLLSKYHIEPKYLELEITESSMVNVNETHSILTKLKQLGVFVSVDDFGTGYSSLSYLKKYPIDIIKIDQSFIRDINKDDRNEAIIKAIITLSHNLGMEVVAEGVEDKFQEQFLKDHQCRKGQGYLYNKPLPVAQIVQEYFVN